MFNVALFFDHQGDFRQFIRLCLYNFSMLIYCLMGYVEVQVNTWRNLLETFSFIAQLISISDFMSHTVIIMPLNMIVHKKILHGIL